MSDTILITYKGIDLHIDCNYEPADSGTMYHSDMSGTPPTPAMAEIKEIWYGNNQHRVSFYELLEDQLEEIEQEIINYYER